MFGRRAFNRFTNRRLKIVNWAQYSYAQEQSSTAYYTDPYQAPAAGRPSFDTAMPNTFISYLKARGFDAVRFPVDPTPLFIAANDTALDALIDIVLYPISKFIAGGLKVILDMHVNPYPGVHDSVSAASQFNTVDVLDGPTGTKFLRMVYCYRRLLSAVAALDYGSEVAFEMFNEPPPLSAMTGLQSWATVQAPALHLAIRSKFPKLPIVVSGDTYGGADGLSRLTASNFDANTIFSFHDYSQNIYSHQRTPHGTLTPSDSVSYMSRVPYPPGSGASKATCKSVMADNINADVWGQSLSSGAKAALITQGNGYLDDYFDTPYDKAWKRTFSFNGVGTWLTANSVPGYSGLLGEFGGWGDIGSALGSDVTSKANFLKDSCDLAGEIGVSYAVWELQGTSNSAWYITATQGGQTIRSEYITALGLTA